MAKALNSFADFIADFPYDSAWMEDPTKDLPGKELTALLANGLRERDFEIQIVGPIGHGYVIECQSHLRSLTISITVDDPWEMRRWNVECTPGGPWWAPFTVHPDQTAHRKLVMAIHEILTESKRIWDVRWFPSYESPGNLRDRDADASPLQHTKTVK